MIDEINIILYIIIAISGTVFGSFFTLAVHRIPKHQDITHERSYCPNCNHKLQFLDLIPVFSYIFLGGKCRYCGNKIRPRYLILELCSGLVFVLLAISLKITYLSSLKEWIVFFLNILFLVSLFITAGIDKEHHKIIDGVMLYGFIIGLFKLIYNIVYDYPILSQTVSFVVCILLWFVMHFALSKTKATEYNYIQDLLLLFAIIGLFADYIFLLEIVIITITLSLIHLIVSKIKNKQEKIPVGFLVAFSYVILIVANIIINNLRCV